MGFWEKSGSGIVFFIIVVLFAALFIFSVRQENDAQNPFDGLFTGVSASDNNSKMDYFFDYYPQSGGEGGYSLVETYFCPSDYCSDKLINKIDDADSNIFIAIYSFTHDGIGDALIRAKNRGVDVWVIYDSLQSKNSASDDELLIDKGIRVAYRNGSGYMHNKYTIIDMNFVATGSFNYSNNADTRNEENLVFIHSVEVASVFKKNFDTIWSKSNTN
ncbi:MAG: phospholipase D-like domain-containing protein [Candidatus Iainarchaeum sp.]|jgi:phosphatidylserine/phosphatidylglycerophosphate/cardiolipin synthase-like enzyme